MKTKEKTHTKLFWMEKSEKKSERIRMENAKRKHMKKRDQISNYWLLVYTSKEKPNSNKLHSFNSSVFFSHSFTNVWFLFPFVEWKFILLFFFKTFLLKMMKKKFGKVFLFLEYEKKESLEQNFNLLYEKI